MAKILLSYKAQTSKTSSSLPPSLQKQWQQLGYRLIGTYLVIGIRRRHHTAWYHLEKGREQILRELSVKVISLLTICVKRELRE